LATAPFTCFAIAAPGLEPLVAQELTNLGERPRIDDGGVAWDGDARSVMRANLWLRTASRVVVRLARFRATEFFELEKSAKKIPWATFLGPGRAAEFRVTAHKSKLYHSDAIAERLLSAVGSRPSANSKGRAEIREPRAESQLFVVRVVRDEFEISADTSGELLHMRGYRQAIGKAPLRETLAAALLVGSGWSGESPLVDPMCGSGTIAIEGALLARRMAPGLNRSFAFQAWPDFDANLWEGLSSEARTQALASSPVAIAASDRDAGAIESASANAERAGVSADIELSRRALSAMVLPNQTGLIATNPPYGKRASHGSDVRNLYAQFGNVVRDRGRGWRIALYSPEQRLAREIHIQLSELFRTSNGGIKVAAVSGLVPD
jgi:putative N6-adenine-specific DNA methylase